MPTPPPGRPGAPPRRGISGLAGLLAVLAFVILAAVILTRREPEPAAKVPPPSTSAPAPTTTLAAPPSEAPPSAEPEAGAVASVTPAEPAVAPPPAGKTPRSPRHAGSTPAGGVRTADAVLPTSGGPGLPPPSGVGARRFVLGTTSIESLKPVQRDLKGFEADQVGVKRAPEVNGRVELEMDPPTMRPGVDYTVKVYLANDGGKDIPVQEMKVLTVENGKSSSRAVAPQARLVRPRQRALLGEISGVWREAARSWAMDVVVTSTRQDVYRNRLHWE